jgi:hypothetical protein
MLITIREELQKSSITDVPKIILIRFEKLPNQLKDLLLNCLGGWVKHFGLKEIMWTESEKDPDYAIFIYPGWLNSQLVINIHRDERSEIKHVLRLLRWYLKPHFYQMPGDWLCSECSAIQVVSSLYCNDPSCPSHKKWSEIIGPSYKPPHKEDAPWPYSKMMTPEEMNAFTEQVKALKP